MNNEKKFIKVIGKLAEILHSNPYITLSYGLKEGGPMLNGLELLEFLTFDEKTGITVILPPFIEAFKTARVIHAKGLEEMEFEQEQDEGG